MYATSISEITRTVLPRDALASVQRVRIAQLTIHLMAKCECLSQAVTVSVRLNYGMAQRPPLVLPTLNIFFRRMSPIASVMSSLRQSVVLSDHFVFSFSFAQTGELIFICNVM